MSGDDREDAVLASLRSLLAKTPWSGMSISDITAGAGISRPTFYFYFASKDAALLALYETVMEATETAYAEASALLAEDPARAWRTALEGTHRVWVEHRAVLAAAAEARAANAEIRERWSHAMTRFVDRTAAAIRAERARGTAPEGLDAHELAVCLNLMAERVLLGMLTDEEPSLADDRVLDALVETWLRAIYGV